MSLSGLALLKIIYDKLKDVVPAAFKLTRTARAEFTSARQPEKTEPLTESTFEAPLRRLQSPSSKDSIVDVAQRVLAKGLLPSQLTNVSARQFFDDPEVVDALREVQSADLLGRTPPPDTLERLARRFEEVASANEQESEGFVRSIRAVLVANVASRVDDAGGAATTAAAAGLVLNKLDRLEAAVGNIALPQARPSEPDDKTLSAWRVAIIAASQPLLGWRRVVGAGAGDHIERPELARLYELLEQEEPVTCALLGDPGSGKSALLSQFAGELVKRGDVTVLAIKADLISASVASEGDLQVDLGLPEPPSLMLRKIAKHGPVVLLLDQVDALADRLDLKTSRLSLLLTLVQQMSFVEGVRIFLSCRTFEFRHDTRLTTISAEAVLLGRPSWEEVVPILEANNVVTSGWPQDAKDVLRVPQQLNTFLQLRSEGIEEPVSTYQAMLERLWNSRVVSGQRPQVHQLAYRIAEMMADREELWLSRSVIEDLDDDLTALLATGVLTAGAHGKIGFSHQTVFDYVLARSFVKTEGSLSTYVVGRMNSLFVRPKALSGLTYLRNTQGSSYDTEFRTLWRMPTLRPHLRFLLIDFLGSQSQPSDQEMIYMVEAFESQQLRPLVLKAITGSTGWFKRLATNVIPQAMSDDALADLCYPLLATGWTVEPDTVTRLLTQRWASTCKQDRATLAVLRDAPSWTDANLRLAQLILGRITAGAIYVENIIGAVGIDSPVIATRMLRWYLDGELDRRAAQGAEAARKRTENKDDGDDILSVSAPTRPVLDMLDDSNLWDGLASIAERAPEQFAELIWPWFVRACRAVADLMPGGPERYFGYALWYYIDFRFDGEVANGLPVPALLDAITIALEKMSEDSPDKLKQWVRDQEKIELTPVHRMVAHTLAHNPQRFSQLALDYLMADERRFYLGTSHDSWISSVLLIEAVSPFWDQAEVKAFVNKVKSYSPARPPELTDPSSIKHWSRTVRLTRLAMVRALPARARPSEVQKNIDEESRIFPKRPPRTDMMGGFIGSPISVEQLLKASPAEIINAFKKIPDRSEWDHPRDMMRGGNIQLSRALAEASKQKPPHGMAVLQLLEPAFGQRAAGAIVEEFGKGGVDTDELMRQLVRLHHAGFGSEDESPFRYSAAQAVSSLLERKVRVSDAVLAMLEGWLERGPREHDQRGPLGIENAVGDPRRFLLSGFQGGQGYDDPDYTLLIDVIYARYERGEKEQLLATLKRYLAGPYSLQAWEGVLDRLGPMVETSPPHGKAFIGELLTSLPELDGTRGPSHLMANIYQIAPAEVSAGLRRWRDSARLSARKGYGELVALIAIVGGDKEVGDWLAELAREPQYADAREGAAATAVQILWQEHEFRPQATRLLLELIQKNEAPVWQQFFELFNLVDRLEAEPYTLGILEAIASNIESSPLPQSSEIIERLNTLLPLHAHLVGRIASTLIRRWRDQLSDTGSALGTGAGQHVISLAMTLHGLDATKLEGLTMFEQLLEIDAYQARETLDEIDHRIRPGYEPRIRRTPRRARRRPRKTSL